MESALLTINGQSSLKLHPTGLANKYGFMSDGQLFYGGHFKDASFQLSKQFKHPVVFFQFTPIGSSSVSYAELINIGRDIKA